MEAQLRGSAIPVLSNEYFFLKYQLLGDEVICGPIK